VTIIHLKLGKNKVKISEEYKPSPSTAVAPARPNATKGHATRDILCLQALPASGSGWREAGPNRRCGVTVFQCKCHLKCARNSWLDFDKIPVRDDADATSVLFLEQTKRHHFTKLELADRKLGFDDRFTLIRETKN
jgi:hypothetical protein